MEEEGRGGRERWTRGERREEWRREGRRRE